jgi:hypothetical protein
MTELLAFIDAHQILTVGIVVVVSCWTPIKIKIEHGEWVKK